MSVIQIQKDDMTFFIECRDIPEYEGRRDTKTTAISGNKDLFFTEQVFEQIGRIAHTVASHVKKGVVTSEYAPSEFELELSFTVTTAGNILVLSGETETGITLRMKWEN